MIGIASLEESGLVLSMEAFSFTYEVEAKGEEGMGVIGRCGCVGEVDSRTEWVLGRDVMDSVCETDDRGADGTDDGSADDGTYNGSADECANNGCADRNANNHSTNDASNANPYNTPSHNDSNGIANYSTSHT